MGSNARLKIVASEGFKFTVMLLEELETLFGISVNVTNVLGYVPMIKPLSSGIP